MENTSFVVFAEVPDPQTPEGGTPGAATDGTTEASPFGGLGMMIPMIIIIGMMFAFSLRTSSKEKKKREEMLNSIRKGTKIMTSGGIIGEIAEVQKDQFLLKVANNVQIAISRTAIAQVIQPSEDAADAADDTKSEVKKK